MMEAKEEAEGLGATISSFGKRASYQTISSKNGQATEGSGTSPSMVLCIHGNKYGFARCCNDLSLERTTEFGYTLQQNEGEGTYQEHCHVGNLDVKMDKKARKKLVIASVLCLVFMIIEIVGGVLAGSLAIATDAAHLMTDFASFLISLFSLWVASRPATKSMSFGWHRAEVIGATVSVLLIWVVTGILVYAAVLRIVSNDFELDATIMLITSGIGVGVNVIMGCSLHQHGHEHSTASVEPEAAFVGKRGGQEANINVKAAFIHVLGDFIQSIGVLIAATIIFFRPDLKVVDPICTFIFSVLVLVTTIRILRDTMNVLMEGTPRGVNYADVKEAFMSVDGILAVHNLRIWGLTTDKTALSAHLAIAQKVKGQEILKEASKRIRSNYNIYEMTLQVEEFHQDMDECVQCAGPEK